MSLPRSPFRARSIAMRRRVMAGVFGSDVDDAGVSADCVAADGHGSEDGVGSPSRQRGFP